MEKVKKSIFKQKVYELDCYIESYYYVSCNRRGELLREEILEECDIEMPLLQPKEKFYLESLDKVVCINEVMRTSNNNVIYYIEPKLEETQQYLDKKEKLRKMVNDIRVKEDEEVLKKNQLRSDYNSKSWWYKKFHTFEQFIQAIENNK